MSTDDRGAETLANMEVLSARLLHDLAGSVGSMASYVECLVEDPDSESVLDSLEEASEEIIARFRLLRQAYSASEDNSDIEKTRNNIEQYLSKRGIAQLTWEIKIQFADAELMEKVNRLLAHAALLSTMLMIRGSEVAVSVDATAGGDVQLRIKLTAGEVEMHRDIESVLIYRATDECQLNTRNVQAYFMSLLLIRYCAAFCYDAGNSVIEITLPH
ncbi:histidine phosphotransferase family protein [Anaplasma capra]|uniref:histidine phosphotransferase family protein n=1 Tax=Anaplasma capra TaxID=1562740 RepID=UPI0021D5AD9F|nr:histidine phosphotransferase family protein [Anaplasma capra]MCU7611815.1 histidine phosphotransferase family protein [Anaplasma capra]MCU7612591.1 histidine phosphotransferase family protein [Anaplasma capra]